MKKHHHSSLRLTSRTDSRIPKPLITHEALPPANDGLELGERPWFLEEWRLGRRVNIHELEVEDHIELAVPREDVCSELRCIMREGRFADRDEVVVYRGGLG